MRRGFLVLNSSPTSNEAALQAAQNTPNSFISVDTISKDPTTKSIGAITMRGSNEYPITPRTWPYATSPPRTLASKKIVSEPNIQMVIIHETTLKRKKIINKKKNTNKLLSFQKFNSLLHKTAQQAPFQVSASISSTFPSLTNGKCNTNL